MVAMNVLKLGLAWREMNNIIIIQKSTKSINNIYDPNFSLDGFEKLHMNLTRGLGWINLFFGDKAMK